MNAGEFGYVLLSARVITLIEWGYATGTPGPTVAPGAAIYHLPGSPRGYTYPPRGGPDLWMHDSKARPSRTIDTPSHEEGTPTRLLEVTGSSPGAAALVTIFFRSKVGARQINLKVNSVMNLLPIPWT